MPLFKGLLIRSWVPYSLITELKAERVKAAKTLLQCFEHPNNELSMVNVDEKWSYLRSVGRRRSNRSWVGGSGDFQEPMKSVKRNQFETKFMAAIGVTFTGKHHFVVLELRESMNNERYMAFLKTLVSTFSRHVSPLTWESVILL